MPVKKLLVTISSVVRVFPVKIETIGAKLEPVQVAMAVPLLGAVHAHHTELEPSRNPELGSPNSRVAARFFPYTVTLEPVMKIRFANASFGGGGISSIARVNQVPSP